VFSLPPVRFRQLDVERTIPAGGPEANALFIPATSVISIKGVSRYCVSRYCELARDGSCRAANWNLRKDNSRIWCQWYNVAKYDDAGELQECQSIALDATSQYEREQHLLTEKNPLSPLSDPLNGAPKLLTSKANS
jgi:hypothetical protein